MPASTAKQKRFMDAASKGMTFKGDKSRADRQVVNNPETNQGKGELFKRGGDMKESKAMEMRHVAAMKKAGVPKSIVKEEQAEAASMKRGGGVKKMAAGGFVRAADGVAQRGKTKAAQVKMSCGGKTKK